MAIKNMNGKKFIIEYYDSLVNTIDIYAEQLLEKYTADDLIQNKTNSVQLEPPLMHRCPLWCPCEKELIYQDPYKEGYQLKEEFKHDKLDPDLTTVHDYINRMRQEMIDELSRLQDETMAKYEQKRKGKNEMKADDLFAYKLPFVIILKKFDPKSKIIKKESYTQGLFQCFLIVINFYMDFITQSYLK